MAKNAGNTIEDRLSTLQEKMEEYIANGAQSGWLIDPKAKQIYVYRPGRHPERLENPETISGNPVLQGFILETKEIW